MYKQGGEDLHPTFIPPFITATVAIDADDKPIKVAQPHEKEYALYSGDCSCDKPNKHRANLLVLGPTGAGKTTFVDSFVNFVLGIEIYDRFRYKLVDEKHIEE